MADHDFTTSSVMRKIAAAVVALAVIATAAAAAVGLTGPAHADELVYGEDVSHYEATHDWAASDAEFGIVKATEGTHFTDETFARHWAEMSKHDIVRGAYHFGRPANDPVAEADFFLSVVNGQPARPGDLLVLDLEATDGRSAGEVNAWAKKWLERVKDKTGITPLFYSSWNFASEHGAGLGEYPLWVAHYGRSKGEVTPPAPWKEWTIHQYTDDPVDMNVASVSLDELRALGRK